METMYLVMLRHTLDDLPVYLTPGYADARRFAEQVDATPSQQIRNVYNTDCSTPCSVFVVTFEDGRPVKVEYVRDVACNIE